MNEDHYENKGIRWKPFVPGQIVTEADILAAKNISDVQRHMIYEVRWTCCGAIDEISHALLIKRLKEGCYLCKKCSRRTAGRRFPSGRLSLHIARPVSTKPRHRPYVPVAQDYGVTPPGWLPPPSVLANRDYREWHHNMLRVAANSV